MSVRVSRHKKKGWIEVDIRVRLPDGTRHREKVKSPVQTVSGATRWAEERIRHLVVNGRAKAKEVAPTLEGFMPRFLEEHVRANQLKPSTQDTYEYRLKRHLVPLLGKKRLDEIGKADVQRLKASLAEQEPKSINGTLGVLSKLLNAAVDWDVIPVTPRIKMLRSWASPTPSTTSMSTSGS